ncbi:hypothetical protein SAMN04244579_03519 [Azotobacter beijerinckii]|uniref:Uncharacterized protein n=1 Tax=Azotobacter beijerinckii TaxID=170623 RepID=A0A1H6X9J4_9GAMM|nr:hypothetical protein [Azotobacter beijerinckii]SEJ21570.1 hypothetical protein SAMN04244579_03519 [Azotobacter beijerinckii]
MLRLTTVLVLAAIAMITHASQEALTKRQLASIKSQVTEAAEVFNYASVGPLSNNTEKYFIASFETSADQHRNEKESTESQESIQRCAIFFMRGDGFTLLAKSGPLISYGPRDGINCAVASGSVEIHHRNSSTLCSEFNETWKFKLSNSQFILVGYDSASSDGCESPVFAETATSINFLSNEARLWRKSGEVIELWSKTARWNKPYVIKKATRNKEFSIRIEPHMQFVFELFDIEAFEGWMKQHKDLCGYIDEHYKYVPCR